MTMMIGSFGFALPLMLLLLVSFVGAALGSYACNVHKFDPTAPFDATLNNLLSNMEQHTPSTGVGYKTSVAGSGGSPTAYGESVCDAPFSATNCTNCLTSNFNQLLAFCGFAIGAQEIRAAPFNATLNNLLSNMEQHTPSSGVGYNKSVAGSGGSPTAYGGSVRDAPLSATACTNCLTSIFNQLLAICGFAIGAQGKSTQCSLRYEQYQF